jgi:hypothetical protein
MKIKDLIAQLAASDPEAEVTIAIRQYNKRNAVAYCLAFAADGDRIYCALPDNMHTVERKVKA